MSSITSFFDNPAPALSTQSTLSYNGQTVAARGPDAVEPEKNSEMVNALTGFLGKAADTGLEILKIREAGKAIGSAYPTGQVSPATAASQAQAAAAAPSTAPASVSAGMSSTQKALLIGGVAVAGLLVVVLLARK